jgi:hypothetical protein
MSTPRRNLAEHLPEPSQLGEDEVDVLSLLTMTVALFGLALTSVVSLYGLLLG